MYRQEVLEVPDVIDVKTIKGRYHGSSVFVDVTIVVKPDITLDEAHEICDRVETYMHERGSLLFMCIQNLIILKGIKN